ncbi:hypothetical protein [Halostella litorea]|uniref:hypothetical protein n=1 Tax=Halostella litorea TaxID=2528831 RepID=UPI0013870EA6|nr:hypothetical protein [Halostella litorea]
MIYKLVLSFEDTVTIGWELTLLNRFKTEAGRSIFVKCVLDTDTGFGEIVLGKLRRVKMRGIDVYRIPSRSFHRVVYSDCFLIGSSSELVNIGEDFLVVSLDGYIEGSGFITLVFEAEPGDRLFWRPHETETPTRKGADADPEQGSPMHVIQGILSKQKELGG